jgi:hypothetical protein
MMRTFRAAALLLTVLVVTGCRAVGDRPAALAPQDTTDQNAVLSVLESVLLDSLRRSPLREAFGQLAAHEYTRFVRTEQFDADGRRVAIAERVTRHAPSNATSILQSTIDGTFDNGAFGRLADRETSYVAMLPDLVVRELPPYLSPRKREAYRYTLMPDTVLWGIPARVVEVRAGMPEESVRRARLYVDTGEGHLIAYAVERDERALLYREQSRLFISIRPGPDGGWVPFTTRFDVRLRIPFHATQRLQTVAAYYNYGATVRAATASPGVPRSE